MLNFNRRDRSDETPDAAKTVLKPAIYEPPGSANAGGGGAPRTMPAAPPHAGDSAARPLAAPPAAPATPKPQTGEVPESRLFVGPNIKLKGVEICDCDSLVIEGHVEATVHSKAMEIAKPGTLSGTAQIDVADIHGEFVGDLTVRTRLTVHATGRVSGTIRYGKLIVAEGGELTGDVRRLDADGTPIAVTAAVAGLRSPLSPSAEKWSN